MNERKTEREKKYKEKKKKMEKNCKQNWIDENWIDENWIDFLLHRWHYPTEYENNWTQMLKESTMREENSKKGFKYSDWESMSSCGSQ